MSGQAERIAKALGGHRAGHGWLAMCPAHPNRHTPALSISDGRGGRLLLKCHAGCTFRDIRAALAAKGLLEADEAWTPPDPAQEARLAAEEAAQRRRRVAYAIGLFDEALPAPDSPVERYLLRARGLPLRGIPSVLRFHPKAPHPAGQGLRLPAMLARVDAPDGAPVGVHRTFLAPDRTGKADVQPTKASLGPIGGGAVRLAPAGPDLAIGEGIESTLAFAAVLRIPAWAALSTSGLRGIELPSLPLAARITIAADNDKAGLSAAEELADRAAGEGREVQIALPPDDGADFNDLLRRGTQ